jgi:L-lactate dehydrogenase complex protein LldG
MGSRAEILEKLSRKKTAFGLDGADSGYHHVVPDISDNPEEMLSQFIEAAEKLSCKIHQVADEENAIEVILTLIEGEEKILGWDFEEIGLPGLEEALAQRGTNIDASANPEVRYGLTGADAALAATGSIILTSGTGKPRAASLLPPIHIAVLRSEQITQDLEGWVSAKQKKEKKFQDASNIFVISGPSKTADIAMELVMGMHGPQEVHLVLVNS